MNEICATRSHMPISKLEEEVERLSALLEEKEREIAKLLDVVRGVASWGLRYNDTLTWPDKYEIRNISRECREIVLARGYHYDDGAWVTLEQATNQMIRRE